MNFPWLVAGVKTSEVYEPAIDFAKERNKTKCDEYFKAVVEFVAEDSKLELDAAEKIVRGNIGYWAGYHTLDERKLVLEYYNAHHPILPLQKLTPQELFDLGAEMALTHTIEQQIKNEINKK